MRAPRPGALLVDHPALATPRPLGGRRVEAEVVGPQVAPGKLGRQQRESLAAQVVALCVVLGEFDLWPGRRNLAAARAIRRERGVAAVVPGFPLELSVVYRRLGGGEGATEALRQAVVDAVADAFRVSRASFQEVTADDGFYLDPILDRLLDRMPLPLDDGVARALWGVRLDLPTLPEEGEVVYWKVPHRRLSRRLAVAAWSATRNMGGAAWYRDLDGQDAETAPLPGLGLSGTLVVSGELREDELVAVERWVRRPGCRAVVAGRFPSGWNPPQPDGIVGAHLERHLAVAGTTPERSSLVVRLRRGLFDPLARPDRRALTRAAAHRFSGGSSTEADGDGTPGAAGVRHVLGLVPEGVPEAFIVLHSGLPPATVTRVVAEEGVGQAGERWRLAEPSLLRRDPLHTEAAALFESSDPRRLRHLALATGDSEDLLAWVRRSLGELRHRDVRAVLEPVASGELGRDVQLGLVEACLAGLDVAAARRHLGTLPKGETGPWRRWLEALDPRPGAAPIVPDPEDVERSPRAAAAAAVRALRDTPSPSPAHRAAVAEILRLAASRLEGDLAASIDIEHAAVAAPHRLSDRAWRREKAAGRRQLWHLLLARRADGLVKDGRLAAAYRMRRTCAQSAPTPGGRGLAELEAARLAARLSRRSEAHGHRRRAHRLLQVAGFRHRADDLLVVLAAADVDTLRLDRAERRLSMLEPRVGAETTAVQMARVALARGWLDRFDELLEKARSVTPPIGVPEGPDCTTLVGVRTLLDGEAGEALLQLRNGRGAKPWLELAETLAGTSPDPAAEALDDANDPWGIRHAAALAARIAEHGLTTAIGRASHQDRLPSLREALGTALAVHVSKEAAEGGSEALDAVVERLRRDGLEGWADRLQGATRTQDGVVEALARLVEGGDPATVGRETWRPVLATIGISGVEVRRADGDGSALWRVGEGIAGHGHRRGHVEIVPLGATPAPTSAWSLLGGILELLAPKLPLGLDDPDGERTGIHGSSAAVRRLREDVQRYAGNAIPVIVHGETGTGKEVVANALHRLSGRPGRFVAVNIAAVPSTLLEAELFGSVRGAYTGADRPRKGLVDSADRGTLFLDEIGDLDLPLQVKLLRFLESLEVRPVGGERAHSVDVRIVAATHRDLERRRQDGRFRADLYYRLAGARIEIPPLRERLEDIPVLRRLFEREASLTHGLPVPRWTSAAERVLRTASWPGNVRQLRAVVVEAMSRASGGSVTADMLSPASAEPAPTGTWDEAVREFRRRLLETTLERTGGNRSAAARELGISRQTLLYHLNALGLGSRRPR